MCKFCDREREKKYITGRGKTCSKMLKKSVTYELTANTRTNIEPSNETAILTCLKAYKSD